MTLDYGYLLVKKVEVLTMTLGGSTEVMMFLTVNGTAYDGSLEGIVVESTDNVITMSIDGEPSAKWSILLVC